MPGIPQYNRSAVGVSVAAPDTQGVRAAASATNQFLSRLNELANVTDNISDKYNAAIESRVAREAKTEASRLFRERAFEVQKSTQLGQTDGLIDREKEWAAQAKNAFAQKFSRVKTETLEGLWAGEEDSYLTKIGSYQLSEQAKADRQSRIAFLDEARNHLVNYEIGDMSGVQQYLQHVKQTLPGRDGDAIKAADQGMMDQIKIWSRRDPKATISWFTQNRETLEQQFGSDVVKISDVIKSAEDHVRAEASYQEAQAARDERLLRREQEAYDKTVAKQHFMNIYNGNFDYRAVVDDPKMSVETKKTLLSTFEHVGKNAYTEQADLKGAFYVDQAHTQEWTDDLESALQRDAASGLIKPGQLNTIRNVIEQREKVWKTEKSSVLKSASEYLKNAVAPTKGTLMPTDPESENRYLKMQAVLAKVAADKDLVALTKDFDVNDPGSFINKFIEINRPTKNTPKINMGGVSLGWTPQVPGAAASSAGAVPEPRRPGESAADYLKRTGK